jgi:hypothetical protein
MGKQLKIEFLISLLLLRLCGHTFLHHFLT